MLALQIDEDLKAAMKSKDHIKVSTLRMLKAACKNAEIEKKKPQLDDNELLSLTSKLIKQRRESIEEFKKGNRMDLVQQEEAEIKVLQSYLPQALSDQELDRIIADAIQETGASKRADMSKVMKVVMQKAAGRADGSLISQKVAARLQ